MADEQFTLRIPVAKREPVKRTVTGWAALSLDAKGNPVIDHQGDYIPVEELEKAASQLMKDGGSGRAGEMHERRVGDIVEMAVLTPDKLQQLGYQNADGPAGLVVTMKIHDDKAWERIASGELNELSISGTGERVAING